MTMTCPRAVAQLVIGNHHLGHCLYIFAMTTVLGYNATIPLNFTSGTILVLQATQPGRPVGFDYTTFHLNLSNKIGDTLLYLSFSGKAIVFRDRAHRTLGDGWGEAQTVKFKRVDSMKGQSVYNVRVSIHHYLTDSEFGRYQILLNGKTVYHLDKRFPGPATQIKYTSDINYGPISWAVDAFQVDKLLPEEQLVLSPSR